MSLSISCKKFVEIEAPKTEIVTELVFSNDETAKSAMSGIYSEMVNGNNLASGGFTSINHLAGLSSDEFINYNASQDIVAFYTTSLLSTNGPLRSGLWQPAYKYIYYANAILEGVASAENITSATKNQLRGESLFLRAFYYFYLVNSFGDVPLVTMKRYIKNIACIALVASLFTACKKEDLDTGNAMEIVVNGYNGGANALQMSIDTTQYGVAARYGSYIIKPDFIIATSLVYTYRSSKKRMLTLTDTITKKVVYSKELPATGMKAAFNYLFLDGKEVEVNPPAADPNTNKLGFYIYYYTASDEPFDIFLYRKDNNTGQEFRTYIAKNVTPGKWIYLDYTVPADFGTNRIIGNSNASVYFTKAGTTDQWAFDNDENKSKVPANSMFLPVEDEKGLVQPYFYTPLPYGQGLSKLFFYPDRL